MVTSVSARLLAVGVALLACILGVARADDELDLAAALTWDPAIRRGTLENGMRWVIQPMQRPARGISLLLLVEVGGGYEEPGEQGYAHFVEHMAFNGTKHFPADSAVRYFESLGLVLGAHVGAQTRNFHTTFHLHLTGSAEPHVKKAMFFLSDVARGISFLPEQVEQEKRVILSEARTLDTPAKRIRRRLAEVVLRGTRLASANALGDEGHIRSATPSSLATFYRRWYRPEKMTLIVAGQIGHDYEATIREYFGGWRPDAPRHIQPPVGALNPPPFSVIPAPSTEAASLCLYSHQATEQLRTIADFRRETVKEVTQDLIKVRLRALVRRRKITLTAASVADVSPSPALRFVAIAAQAPSDAWEQAVGELATELRRMQLYGFSEAEWSSVLASRSRPLASPVEPSKLASEIALRIRWGGPCLARAHGRALTEAVLRGFGKTDVAQALGRMLAPDDTSLILVVPGRPGDTAVPGADALMSVWVRAMNAKVSARPSVAPSAPIVLPAPSGVKAGDIASTTGAGVLGIVTLGMANGVPVHFRRSHRGSSHVHLRASFVGGVINEDEELRGITDLAMAAYADGAFATQEIDSERMRSFLEDKQIQVDADLVEGAMRMSVRVPTKSIAEGLQILRLMITEPQVHLEEFAARKERTAAYLRALQSDVDLVGQLWLDDFMSQSDCRCRPPTWERYVRITRDQTQAWLDGMLRTAPMSVTIVGDVEEESVRALCKQWLASLPKRPMRGPRLRRVRATSIAKGPLRRTGRIVSSSSSALVIAAWRDPEPQAGPTRRDRRDEAAYWTRRADLCLATLALESRLRGELRERSGVTYDVTAVYRASAFPGMSRLLVRLEVDPVSAEATAQKVEQLCRDFVLSGPTVSELNVAQAQARGLQAIYARDSHHCADMIDRVATESGAVAHIATFLAALRTMDTDRVTSVLRSLVVEKSLFVITVLPTAR